MATDSDAGLRRSDLVNWYLHDIEAEIDSEAELMERKTIVEKVIFRLVHHVSCLRFKITIYSTLLYSVTCHILVYVF